MVNQKTVLKKKKKKASGTWSCASCLHMQYFPPNQWVLFPVVALPCGWSLRPVGGDRYTTWLIMSVQVMCFPRSESVIAVSLGWRNQTRMFLQMKPPSLLLPLTKVVLRALFFPKIPACPAWGLFICLVYKPECPTFPDEPADCSLFWLRSQEQAGARLLTKLLRA